MRKRLILHCYRNGVISQQINAKKIYISFIKRRHLFGLQTVIILLIK